MEKTQQPTVLKTSWFCRHCKSVSGAADEFLI